MLMQCDKHREAHYVAEAVSETQMLCSMDLVEVNPDLVPGEGATKTVEFGVDLIASALGSTIV